MKSKYDKFIENDLIMMDGFTSLSLLAQMYRSKVKHIKIMIGAAQRKAEKSLTKSLWEQMNYNYGRK